MRKRAILIFIVIAIAATAIVAYVLLRHATPPSTVKLLPPADAYLYFDLATVRRAAVLGELPKVEFESDYADFVRETGFNLEQDLDEAAFALQRSSSNPQQAEWRNTGVFTVSFDRAKVDAYFKKTASTTETYRNTTVYVIPLPGRTVRVAILGPKTVAATNTDGPYVMQGIIDRHAQFSSGEPELIHSFYSNIPLGTLAWAIARPPATTPGGNVRLELPGGLGVYLPPETVVVASLRYLGSVDFRAQAIATSNDAAQRVADQLSAFLALFHALQSQAHGGDKDVKGFFDSIKVTLDGNRAEMQATVPAGFVKKLVSEAPAKGMDAEPSSSGSKRQPVEVWSGGDDGLTNRLRDSVEKAFSQSSEFALSSGKKPGTLVVTIPTHVNWKKVGKRTQVLYAVEFSTANDRKISSSKGSCWDDALDKCGAEIVAKAKVAGHASVAR